ncbi:hypothetical protein CBR_g47157 [Chara braunii]|uniref:Uncharacterized protein n=1 Tax=Chara braunii TaxID=69332 RepID=A0A388M1J7_CHABU|nr:hypothetical protein CBR_g47157 [Chara braunii]|eukprot:GBG88458.1 hypothetical protein CBR_g47157 [Chara braunii]
MKSPIDKHTLRTRRDSDVTRISTQRTLCVREEEVSRHQTNVGAHLAQERNTIRDVTQHANSEEVKSVRTKLIEIHREGSKRKLQMEETEKEDNGIDIRRREESSKYIPKSKTVRRKTVGGATPLAPTKHVTQNKRDHNKGEAADVDSAEVGGSGEDIEGSMHCGRQTGESSGNRHIEGRDIQYRERRVEQQGRQAPSTDCKDQQLEQNEPNTEEDESEDENNRDNDDFGERESNEDEDEDNEEIREDDDENDAHCTNKKATEMYLSVDTYVDAFMGLTESLDPDTRFIVDPSMKSTTPTTLRTQGSRELTNIRGEIAYDIIRVFGVPQGCLIHAEL